MDILGRSPVTHQRVWYYLARTALAALTLFQSVPLLAQSAVDTAIGQRNAGDVAGAVRLLRARVADAPEDGEAARLLAESLYWMQDIEGARAVYEASLLRHPADYRLRIEYGRMLVQTRDAVRARAVLTPLRALPDSRADACALLGTLSYWEGDLSAAAALFSDALAANPAQEEARRQLGEIKAVSSSWVRFSPGLWHDDQPLDRTTMTMEIGWFVTPLTPLVARVQPLRFVSDRATRSVWSGEVETKHFAPRLRLDTVAALGAVRRSAAAGTSTDWTGRAAVGLRLPGRVTVMGRVERLPYLSTTASLDTAVMIQSMGGEARWDHPRGWTGEIAFNRQRFEDGNTIRSGYGWMLAPVVNHGQGRLQVGYAFARDHAEASRFVPDRPSLGGPVARSQSALVGHYEPYYTPAHVKKQSVIAAATLQPSPRVVVRLGGSYAPRATEDAPLLVGIASGPALTFVNRAFSTWEARGSLEITAANGLVVGMGSQFGRSAFYQWATASLDLTYRFSTAGNHRSSPGR